MRKLLLLAPLALASCGLLGTPKTYDVSGTISGTAPGSPIKLALVGVSSTGAVNADVAQVAVTVFDARKFSVDYPDSPAPGIYQVIAYVDANGDGKYNATEKRTENNGKYLIYSASDATVDSVTVKSGWNLFQGTTVTQPGRITNYDLNW